MYLMISEDGELSTSKDLPEGDDLSYYEYVGTLLRFNKETEKFEQAKVESEGEEDEETNTVYSIIEWQAV